MKVHIGLKPSRAFATKQAEPYQNVSVPCWLPSVSRANIKTPRAYLKRQKTNDLLSEHEEPLSTEPYSTTASQKRLDSCSSRSIM